MEAPRKLARFADLAALPDEIRAEVIDGEIVKLPSPLPEHGRLQRTLSSHIGGPFDDGAIAPIPPFEAIEIEVARLFPPRETLGR